MKGGSLLRYLAEGLPRDDGEVGEIAAVEAHALRAVPERVERHRDRAEIGDSAPAERDTWYCRDRHVVLQRDTWY